ncbi:MAG: DNA-directed RNA polymerase subunit beta [Clostridia bacterium]|nr:DNA-directed RNA polymerase subunit beta [Clostridia bacterium]
MTERKIRKVKYGNTERRSFAQVNEVIDMPNLVEVQKKSYADFLGRGISEVLKDFSPITDFSGRIELHFLSHHIEEKSKYSEKECKDRDATYATPLKVRVRLVNKEKQDTAIEQEVFMGDMPKMTPNGSFIINGAERVIVSQLVRSPGVYFSDETKDLRTGKIYYSAQSIPSRGAWLEYEMEQAGTMAVHVDRQRKVPVTTLVRALSAVTTKDYGTDEEICKLFHDEPIIVETCKKDLAHDNENGLLELNKKLRPGEVPNIDSIGQHIASLFFDRRKYDLSRVGRYKLNKKLCLAARITGQVSANDIIDEDGAIIVAAGERISEDKAFEIQNKGINEVALIVPGKDTPFYCMGNGHVNLEGYIGCNPREIGITEWVDYNVLKGYMEQAGGDVDALKQICSENVDVLSVKHIAVMDILSTINYIIGLHYGVGYTDNIDHLGNRRVRSVGELLQNQFRIGISRLERVVRERMQIQSDAELTPQTLINIRPVTAALKEFFGSSQLSQFMDETNPISELTHKRKLSALGPGGLNRERASFEVRDVHYSHYGRMCPIETPEGQNIGLISSLSAYAKINEYGFIEAPYRKVEKVYNSEGRVIGGKVSDNVEYITADVEDRYVVAQAKEPLGEDGWFENDRVLARYREDIVEFDKEDIDYVDVSPRQLVSVATALIPFLENDDTNRALMGSNMQRQAVPLLKPEAPIIGTGIEHKIAYDSGVMVIARESGVVTYVDAETIKIQEETGEAVYRLKKFQGSNQGTCVNQKPIVSKGQEIKKGDVLADGHSTDNGELALGRNILVGFMTWEGYNYEDAILISERIVKDDVFTSIHIAEYETEARVTKLGDEEITRDIPNVGEDALKNLDENGIVYIGTEVTSQDILVGKVTPKGESDLSPEERLMRAIFGDKSHEVRDTSLKVPHGEGGIVVDVKVFTRANKDEMSPGVNKVVRVYIAQKRKIGVGDKMAGRHGNKGVISRVLPEEDMPFMADGTRLQIVLNPLGVPSRMNIGQVLEVHLGLVAKSLGWKIATPVFDSALETDISKLLKDNNLGVNSEGVVDGKIQMYDGRTGEPFENRTTVGYMYMLKLIHLVDDKMHARSIGPYSLVTQQPLGGKAQFGGQRFGEMEVWALYAYGAANILQEIMTVKADDVVGRVKTYESIVKGVNISEPGVPESFKVLIKELQSLGLDVKVLNEDQKEISIKDITEDEAESNDSSQVTRRKHYEYGKLVEDVEYNLDSINDGEIEDDLSAPADQTSTDFKFTDDDLFGTEVEIKDMFDDLENENGDDNLAEDNFDDLLFDDDDEKEGE